MKNSAKQIQDAFNSFLKEHFPGKDLVEIFSYQVPSNINSDVILKKVENNVRIFVKFTFPEPGRKSFFEKARTLFKKIFKK